MFYFVMGLAPVLHGFFPCITVQDMKLALIRPPETGITLRSFSQIIHDLLR